MLRAHSGKCGRDSWQATALSAWDFRRTGVHMNLAELTSNLAAIRQDPRALCLSLAAALDWTELGEATPLGDEDRTVLRAHLHGQPAIVLAAVRTTYASATSSAATFAYHSAVPWGLVADPESLTVFNSHWLTGRDWYRLPPIPWQDIGRAADLLASLSRENLPSGKADEVALRIETPDRLLTPVDDALVERLDYWREEALRYLRDADTVDLSLQLLFAQLFVVRAVEDRGLANLPSLRPLLTAGEPSGRQLLSEVIQAARSHVQSELFADTTSLELPWKILRGVVHDLYIPAHIPVSGVEYNFAWIEADVLGRAYEKYLSTLLTTITADAPQIDLFDHKLSEIQKVSVQKRRGVYYTPPFAVNYLTERALDEFESRAGRISESNLPSFADFSCGSGSFLVAAVSSIIRRAHEAGLQQDLGKELVRRNLVLGVDNDPRAVTLARLSLWLRLAEEPNALPLPALNEAIVHADSLGRALWEGRAAGFDLVLGNPPFLATGYIEDRATLADRFKSAQGRFDYSYLFLELAVGALGPAGALGLVLPNRIMSSRDAASVRQILLERCSILSIIDFGSHEIFAAAKAHVIAIVCRVIDDNAAAETARVIEVKRLPGPLASAIFLSMDKHEGEVSNEWADAFDTSQPRPGTPWILVSSTERRARAALEARGVPLSSLASIYQGIKTGANSIFLVTEASDASGGIAEVVNGLSEEFLIEREFLRRAVSGSSIQRYELPPIDQYVIYPYRGGQPLTESELAYTAPLLHRYLKSHEVVLRQRQSLAASAGEWFALIWPRDEDWLTSPKLLTRELVTAPAFASDLDGSCFLIGGTAVVASQEHLLPLLGYLNSAVSKWYLWSGLPVFGSGFHKIEPRHLSQLPVPAELLADDVVRAELSRLVQDRLLSYSGVGQTRLETKVDALINRIAGVPARFLGR